MGKLRKDFIDGQITCPECSEIFHDQGQIGGRLRWVPSHGDCEGAGARVPLEPLTDAGANDQCFDFHMFNACISD